MLFKDIPTVSSGKRFFQVEWIAVELVEPRGYMCLALAKRFARAAVLIYSRQQLRTVPFTR